MANLRVETRDLIHKDLRTNHAHLKNLEDELVSIDDKLIRGDDENRADALEVSLYARHPNNTDLGLLHMTAGHNLKVSIEEQENPLQVRTTSDVISKSNSTIIVPANGTGISDTIQTTGINIVGIAGSSTNYQDDIELYVSNDDNQYYKALDLEIDPAHGTFYIELENPAFEYYRVFQTDTSGNPHTIDLITSKR
jgi:hypothetical protein